MARYDFHLSEEEFWAMAPFEFFALQDRYLVDLENRDMAAGIIARTVAQAAMGKKGKKLKLTDFMPKRRPCDRAKKQSWEEQLQMVVTLNQLFGGRDLRKKD